MGVGTSLAFAPFPDRGPAILRRTPRHGEGGGRRVPKGGGGPVSAPTPALGERLWSADGARVQVGGVLAEISAGGGGRRMVMLHPSVPHRWAKRRRMHR